jgi:hypothetical protein
MDFRLDTFCSDVADRQFLRLMPFNRLLQLAQGHAACEPLAFADMFGHSFACLRFIFVAD